MTVEPTTSDNPFNILTDTVDEIGNILDEHFPPVVGWTPDRPEPAAPKPLPPVVEDMIAEHVLIEEAADWRSIAAWARGEKKDIAAAKRKRAKRVTAWRAQHGTYTGGEQP
jgi:hypothetical protein